MMNMEQKSTGDVSPKVIVLTKLEFWNRAKVQRRAKIRQELVLRSI